MCIYYEESECDGCGKCIDDTDECYCKGCYDSVVAQLTEVLRIKKALEVRISVVCRWLAKRSE